MAKISKTESEWRERLTPEQFHITREHGTERAFSGPYLNEKRDGEFACVCCGRALFDSSSKFDSGTGWPSFFAPKSSECVSEHEDCKLFMRRVEIRCAYCEAHLGHVFRDGPQPTGLRYCVNGHALTFTPEREQ